MSSVKNIFLIDDDTTFAFLTKRIISNTGIVTNYALYILIGFIFYILIPYLSLADNSLLLLILLSLFSIVNTYTDNTVISSTTK